MPLRLEVSEERGHTVARVAPQPDGVLHEEGEGNSDTEKKKTRRRSTSVQPLFHVSPLVICFLHSLKTLETPAEAEYSKFNLRVRSKTAVGGIEGSFTLADQFAQVG